MHYCLLIDFLMNYFVYPFSTLLLFHLQGGVQLSITFCSSLAVPDDGFLYLFLCGPHGQEHRVPVQRSSPTTLTATLPGNERLK